MQDPEVDDPLQVSEQPSMQDPEHPLPQVLVHVVEQLEHEFDFEVPVHELQQLEAHSAVQSEHNDSFWQLVSNIGLQLKAKRPKTGNTVFVASLKNSLLL